ncbi:MAG: hypothetical protein GOU98_04835 [Candidatus Altiarchaeota archaeon]|nr:hypothetical protein [Candidatus Altiarchaeota archaeon]
MKILAVADIHGDLEKLYKLVNSLDERPDAVIVAGDLTPFGPESLVSKIKTALDPVSDYVFMIPGNEDTKEVRETMEDLGIDMHGKFKEFNDATFIGFEGARWIDDDGEVFIHYDPIHKVLKKAKKTKVLITHVPPFDTHADTLWTGHHVGSPFVRNLVEDYQPDFLICGHIHESRGVEKLGKTTVINTGALADGYAAWIDTKKGVEFFKIGRKVKRFKESLKAKIQ